MTQTPVIGFVMDAIQKMESSRIGRFDAKSANPSTYRCWIELAVATKVTEPAISLSSENFRMAEATPGTTGAMFGSWPLRRTVWVKQEMDKMAAEIKVRRIEDWLSIEETKTTWTRL